MGGIENGWRRIGSQRKRKLLEGYRSYCFLLVVFFYGVCVPVHGIRCQRASLGCSLLYLDIVPDVLLQLIRIELTLKAQNYNNMVDGGQYEER